VSSPVQNYILRKRAERARLRNEVEKD